MGKKKSTNKKHSTGPKSSAPNQNRQPNKAQEESRRQSDNANRDRSGWPRTRRVNQWWASLSRNEKITLIGVMVVLGTAVPGLMLQRKSVDLQSQGIDIAQQADLHSRSAWISFTHMTPGSIVTPGHVEVGAVFENSGPATAINAVGAIGYVIMKHLSKPKPPEEWITFTSLASVSNMAPGHNAAILNDPTNPESRCVVDPADVAGAFPNPPSTDIYVMGLMLYGDAAGGHCTTMCVKFVAADRSFRDCPWYNNEHKPAEECPKKMARSAIGAAH